MEANSKQKIIEYLVRDYNITNSLRKMEKNTGVSSSYLSQMIQKGLDPGDETWNKLASYYNLEINELKIVNTKNYINIQTLCDITREEKIIMAIIGNKGCGKTTALYDYAKNNPHNTIYIRAKKEHSKDFLFRLGEFFGWSLGANRPQHVIDKIRERLLRMNNALIIVDQASDLPPQALLYLREIYLERRLSYSGIIIAGVPCLDLNIKKWANMNKTGFVELLDRIQQPFIQLDLPSPGEVLAMCKANNIDPSFFDAAVNEAERSGSFRAIERAQTNIKIIERLKTLKK
jgi:energy-coupling factor transporter ATP-binding protein EcfA2